MAFIPDDALDRYEELQPKSQIAYSFLCRHRNHKTGVSERTLKDCAVKYGWSRATYFNVKKELENGWISEKVNGIVLQVGDFTPVCKSKKLDSLGEKSLKKWTKKSKKLDLETPKESKKIDLPPHTPQEEYLNITSIKPVSTETKRNARGCRIPEDFSITDKMREWARVHTPNLPIDFETENFRDHYRNAVGSKALGVDWVAKWRTWMRNSFTDFGNYPNGKPSLLIVPAKPLLDISKCPDCKGKGLIFIEGGAKVCTHQSLAQLN